MIIRYIKKYYARSIVIFLSFLFSMIIICTNGIMKDSASKQNIEFLKSRSNGSLVTVTDGSKEMLKYLEGKDYIENIKILNFEDFSDTSEKYRMNIVSKSDVGDNQLKAGRLPKNKSEIAVQEWVLKSIGKSKGDEIKYRSYFDKKEKSRKIVGVLKDVRDDKEMAKMELLTSYTPESLNTSNGISFDIKNNRNLERNYTNTIEVLKKKFKVNPQKIIVNKMLYEAYRNDGNTLKESISLMLLSVLFSSIIVFSTYFISVRDRIRDIGILRAMGISRFDAIKIISEELIVIAVPAMILGTAVSIVFSYIMNSSGKNAYYESIEGAVVEKTAMPLNIIFTAAFMIIISIIFISIVMYCISMRKNPIDSINVENQLKYGVKIKKERKNKNSLLFDRVNIGRALSFKYFKKDSIVMFMIILCMSAAVSEIITNGYELAISSSVIDQEKIIKKGDIFIEKSNAGNDDAKLTDKQVEQIAEMKTVKSSAWSGYKYGSFEIPKNMMNSKEYFDEKNKSPYIKEVLGGLYETKGNNYRIKTVLNGYDYNAIKMLEKNLVSGDINQKELNSGEYCVIYYPKFYVNLKNSRDERNMLLKYKVGDRITVEIPKSLTKKAGDDMLFYKYWKGEYKPETIKKTFKIAGIVDYLPVSSNFGPIDSVGIVLGFDALKKLDYDNSLGYTNGTIFVENGKDKEVYSKALKEIGEDSGLTVVNMYREKIGDENSLGNYLNLESTKYICFILICTMCIFNILSYKVMNKKKDFAMLRALGMTDGDMINMIISEGLIYAGSATILSLVITVIREIMIIKEYEVSYHITGLSMDINVVIYLVVFIVYLLICVLGVYIPSRKLLKENITDGIRGIN